MIKKSIKTYDFTPKPTSTITGGYTITGMAGYTSNTALGYSSFIGGGGTDNITLGHTVGNYTMVVNQGAATAQFTLTNDGTANFSGQVRSLGSVMYNSNLNRLETWNGTNWNPITI